MNKENAVKLIPPFIKRNEQVGQKAGLRPVRQGGVRLELESYKDKLIIHNYGHGGAGVSVGYGYSKNAVNLFKNYIKSQNKNNNNKKKEKVVVLGSGYIGLYTGLILLEEGYDVTIYSDQFVKDTSLVKFDQKNDFPLTSQVAGGVWLPCFYEFDTTKEMRELHDSSASLSYQFYIECLNGINNNNKTVYKGISKRKLYSVPDLEYELNAIPKGIDMQYYKKLITFDDKNYIETHCIETLLIEGDIFLPTLMKQLQLLGCRFIQKTIINKDQLCMNIEEQYIFNCTGLSSKYIFNDQNLYSLKGELAVFQPNNVIDYFFIADLPINNSLDDKSNKKYSDRRVVLFPLSQGITFGHYTKKDDYNQSPTKEVIDILINNSIEYFNRFTLNQQPSPSL